MTATIKFKTAENAAFVGVEEIFKKKFAKCLAKYIKDKTPMTVTKHYEDDHVMLYVKDGETETCITLDSDRQVERLAKCLTDLVRTDGRQVSIG